MTIVNSTPPYAVFNDDNGNPLSGGKVYTYTAGTLTPRATYTDQGGLTPNANPVILDSAGRADIWLDNSASYKFIIKTSADVTIRTVDNVAPFNTASGLSVLGSIAANTLVGNNTGASASPVALTTGQVQAMLGSPILNDFRLTLTSGVPVTTADVTLANAIYCTPYTGNRISLYDGSSNWVTYSATEFSQGISGLTSGRPYDVFAYANSGVPTLEFLSWTNDSTRATALVYQNGILVKSGATTRRYLGTFYTTSTTTTEDSRLNRYLWNNNNRVSRRLQRTESTATWTYSTATWRQANGSASNQLQVVTGVAEDNIDITVFGACAVATGTMNYGAVGVGLDSTSSPTGLQAPGTAGRDPGFYTSAEAAYRDVPAAGRHFFAWLEYASTAGGTMSWAGATGGIQTGIYGNIMA